MPMRRVSVPTTVAQLVAHNDRRSTLALFNGGANTVFISQDQVNVTVDGFPVLANGSVSFSYRDGDEPELVLFAQSITGPNNVQVYEGFGPRIRAEAART